MFVIPTGGWSGFTPLVVFEKVQETDDVFSFHFKKPDGSDLPDFKPGFTI
jgi:ferredoxin-NADP reductase